MRRGHGIRFGKWPSGRPITGDVRPGIGQEDHDGIVSRASRLPNEFACTIDGTRERGAAATGERGERPLRGGDGTSRWEEHLGLIPTKGDQPHRITS